MSNHDTLSRDYRTGTESEMFIGKMRLKLLLLYSAKKSHFQKKQNLRGNKTNARFFHNSISISIEYTFSKTFRNTNILN